VNLDVDEPVEVLDHDARWASWFETDAAEIARTLGDRLRRVEHFGSTSVPGLAAKPIIDVLVAPVAWPLSPEDRESLVSLGYEYLGEAGVSGREYFRRRGQHATNVAVVRFGSPVWRDNLLVRDYLRQHPEVASAYAQRKKEVWANGARKLLAYSEEKASDVARIVDGARRWRDG
jgi:GrpB-like predicted nucleotidyltransferase (UPF0157 family)